MSFEAARDSQESAAPIDRNSVPASLARGRAAAILLLLVAFAVLLVGLQRSLPHFFDVDEDVFANAAARIASTNDLNPGFYGTPGATTIYPLAAGYRAWFALTEQGPRLRADPAFTTHFHQTPLEYYWLGRFLSAAYALIVVALTVAVGRRAFGAFGTHGVYAALGAGWLVAFHGIAVYNAKQVRTDSAATAFGLLALWCILRLLEEPRLLRQVVAGAAVGLAMASRYYMAVLAGVMLLADGVILWQSTNRRKMVLPMLAGFALIPLVFLLANPAMLPNWQAVLTGLRAETVSEHLGGDGLGYGGNLWWYLVTGLPASITWLQVIAAAVGIVLAWRRTPAVAALLVAYLVLILVGISVSPRHFQRYLIQVLPVVALFAAFAVAETANGLANRRKWSPRAVRWMAATGILLLLANPAARVIRLDIQHSGEDTRLLAREWLLATAPAGSRILQEEYGAALANSPLLAEVIRSLPDIADFDAARANYTYWVASSEIYNRYYAEPERYAAQIALYERLFASGAQVAEFPTTWYRNGPTIRIFRTEQLPEELFSQP